MIEMPTTGDKVQITTLLGDVYEGMVVGTCQYAAAKAVSSEDTINIESYHNQVKTANPSDEDIPSSVSDCHFFLITVGSDANTIYPFATEWISTIVSSGDYYAAIVKIKASSADIDALVREIHRKGIPCEVISKTQLYTS